jgi:hypothetical protein
MCYSEVRKIRKWGVLMIKFEPNKFRKAHFERLGLLFQKLSFLLF